MRATWDRLKAGGWRWVLLVSGCLTFAAWFTGRERCFYYYDYLFYHDNYCRILDAFRRSFTEGARMVWAARNNDHSYFFTLPLLPAGRLFGDSRQVYVLAMTLLFLVPYALALGGLAMRLFGDGPRRILWPAVATFLLMPAAWHALLVGYPDPVAALMVALALWAYAVDPHFGKRWQAPAVGAALALAVLLRRHYAHSAVVFAAVLALQSLSFLLTGLLHDPRAALRAGILRLGKLTVLGATAAGLLLVLAPGFAGRALFGADLRALYADYEVPPLSGARHYAGQYGYAFVILAGLGWTTALVRFRDRPAVRF